MNFHISNEEYAEISAKLDASLENISYSDSEDPIEPTPEFIPVSSSIQDSENWKKFIGLRQENDDQQLVLQQQFSEALSSLRCATNEVKFEINLDLQKIPEEPPDSFEYQEPPDPKVLLEPKPYDLNITKISYEGFHIAHDIEKEGEQNEINLMREEDLLSGLFENWAKMQEKMKKAAEEKATRSIVEAEQKKIDRERYIKDKEEKRIKEKIIEKERLDRERKEKLRRDQEMQMQKDEGIKMKIEEKRSILIHLDEKNIKEKERQVSEMKRMSLQDAFSRLYRDLVPFSHKCRPFMITEFSEFPIISLLEEPFSITVSFPISKLISTLPQPIQSFKSLPLPKPVLLSKLPEFTEDPNIEAPTLSNFLPYPLDSRSLSLDVKHEDIKSISGLSFFSNLQILSLSLNKITRIQNLPPSLRSLNLSQNLISSLPEFNLPMLQELVLDLNQITVIEGLDKCVNLRTLSINSNKLTRLSGIDKCLLLEKLLVYRNKIKEVGRDTFRCNSYLIHLDLGRNKLVKVDFLGGLSLLKSVILYQNKIASVQPLILPLLQELWLNGNSLTTLDFIVNCPLLETLRLEDNSISSVKPFCCPLLKFLNISFNSLSKFSSILSCFQLSRNLLSLSCNDNPLLIINPDLLSIFNDIIIKALPNIQELNTTPRTSLVIPSLNSAIICQKAFDLHQIDLFSQRVKRKNEIVRYVAEEMLTLMFQIPSRVYSVVMPGVEFNCRGAEYWWYEARKALHKANKAALVIQTWWKHYLFKKYLLLKRFKPHWGLVVRIQKCFRGYRARKVYTNLRYNPKKIIKIQAAYRGYLLRKKIKQALENAKFNDIDLGEFQEVTFDDVNLDYDFHNDLIIPKNLDLSKFLQPVPEESKTPKLPPIKSAYSARANQNLFNKPSLGDKSLQSSTQSSLPPLHKNKAKEEMEKHLDEWGFTNNDVKEALQYRMLKNLQRKNKKKTYTAEERIEKFRRNSKK